MFETQVGVSNAHKGMMVVDFLSLFFRGHVARHAGGFIVGRNIRFFIEGVNVEDREALSFGTMHKSGIIIRLHVHFPEGNNVDWNAASKEMVRVIDSYKVTHRVTSWD